MQFDGRSYKVVVAEGDRTVLELLQVRLDVAGYHAITARNGAAAMEILRTTRPDALVLELKLPDLDGFEILKFLRNQPERAPIPVLVTGRGLSVEEIRRAISLGARDCLAKPFSGADILDRVARLLKRPSAAARPYVYVDAQDSRSVA